MKDTFDKVVMDESKKAEIRNSMMQSKAKVSRLGVQIAAAAAALVIATPIVVNAATGGELFGRLWGNIGKKNVPSHQATVIDDGKTDDKGNPVTHTEVMPRIEYVAHDPEEAERLIGGKYTTTPVVTTIGDTTISVETVVRDGMGYVVAFSVEREAGVDCLTYSQQDNEGMGARMSEDTNIEFGFEGGEGKIWVDLESSTKTKLNCYEYLSDLSALNPKGEAKPITDNITLVCRELTKTRKEIADMNLEKGSKSFIKDEKTVKIPVAEKLASKTFKAANGETIKLSPIAMQWDSTGGKESKGNNLDSVNSFKITYNDGSEYIIFDRNNPVASYGVLTNSDTGFIVLFNRLVDAEKVAKITVNDTVFVK